MRYSFTTEGLMALAFGTAVTFAAALPRPVESAVGGSHVVEVYRDQEAFHAAILRQTQNGPQKRATTDPYNLDYSSYWFANITAGGLPAQVLLDTGSSDLWLVSPNAGSDSTTDVQTWEPTTATDTTLMAGETFNIGYGTGGNGVSGDVYQSTVCMGTACTIMSLGSATTDQGLGSFPRSGIFGMGFQGGNSVRPDQQPTFMETLAPNLDQPIFAMKLAPQGGTSQISFGAINFPYSGDLQQISCVDANYPNSWSYSGVQYSKDGQALGTFDVVFDTGGPMSSASEDIVRGYYNGVTGATDVNGDASIWTVPCGTPLPDLTLQLGTTTLTIPGDKFYNGNTATSGDCQVWLVKENSPTRAVVGDPLFAQYVVVFNQNDATIQFGTQA